jgi:hypothetical protein
MVVKLSDLTSQAQNLFKNRGGTESLKEDAEELKDVAQGPGSASEKAKEAFEAVKDPGAPGDDTPGS